MIYIIRKHKDKPERCCMWISDSKKWAEIQVACNRDRNAYMVAKGGKYHIIMDGE